MDLYYFKGTAPSSYLSKLIFCTLLSTLGLGLGGTAHAAEDCSSHRAESIRRFAQQLDPKAAEQGEQFLQECKTKRDSSGNLTTVVTWLIYYYRAQGQYPRAFALSKNHAATHDVGTERDRVLSLAESGDTTELEKLIRRGTPGYSGDAETLLILARAMANQHRFADARTYYDSYLKSKPGDRDIEIESAYTYLWEGNARNAEAAFKSLQDAPDLSEPQLQSVNTGYSQAQRLDYVFDRPKHIEPPALDVNGELLNTSFYGFSRETIALSYRGDIANATLATHWLSGTESGTATYGAIEGFLGVATRLGEEDRVSLIARLGGFSTGYSALEYDARLQYRFDGGTSIFVGANQTALAKDLSLPAALSGATRSAAVAGFSYRSLFEARYELRSWSDFTNSNYLYSRLLIPVRDETGVGVGGGAVNVFLTAENEAFSQASIYLYSPHSETTLDLGLQYLADFSDILTGKLTFAYGELFESPQANSGLSFGSGASLILAAAEFGYSLSRSSSAFLRLQLNQTRGDQGTTYEATLFGIGISWRLGGNTK